MSNAQHQISEALFDAFSFIERTTENELVLKTNGSHDGMGTR